MEHSEGDESDGEKDRGVAVQARADRAQYVATIKLGGGQKIEGSGKKANPGGAADWMQEESAGRNAGMEHGGD